MVTKNFVKTAIAGLHSWVSHKLTYLEAQFQKHLSWFTEENALAVAMENQLVDPVTDENGAIYTDKNGEILSL